MKKWLILLLTPILVLGAALSVSAENGTVHYDGESKGFIFAPGSEYSPTDLFPNFKDVMPGDTLEQEITVKNDASKKVKVKIYLRALGAHEASQAFLSELKLTVQKETDTPMFDAAADQTAGLTDWVCLGTLYSGGKVDLNVGLTVPTSLDTTFEKEVGYLDWEFMVEELPIEKDDPKTGDPIPYGAIVAAILAVGSTIVLLWFILTKRKKQAPADR